MIYLSVTSVSFGDDTANSTNWACLNTLFTTSLQSFEIPLNLHMEIPTESIVARVNDIIFEDPAQRSEILPNWLSHPVSFAISLHLKERSICTYRSNPPSWKANSVDSCDPIPPYKHDMMTWTVGIDGKVWSVPPVSIDSAINKTGLRCSYVGAHKQAHIDLPILPHVLMWVNGLFCQRNPREHMQDTHTSMFKYDRIRNM